MQFGRERVKAVVQVVDEGRYLCREMVKMSRCGFSCGALQPMRKRNGMQKKLSLMILFHTVNIPQTPAIQSKTVCTAGCYSCLCLFLMIITQFLNLQRTVPIVHTQRLMDILLIFSTATIQEGQSVHSERVRGFSPDQISQKRYCHDFLVFTHCLFKMVGILVYMTQTI